jgi:hypothetical protein
VAADLPGQPGSLLGRNEELALLEDFLARAAAQGEALLIEGDPGIGKTALLRAAVARAVAAGTRVVKAEGAEFEMMSVFSGLSQILIPLSAGLEVLLPAHRKALAVVLGLAEGAAPKPGQVAHAVLNLVREMAAGQPLLLVVDDLQWMDRYSAEVLSFAARRLGGSRVGFLAAARTGELGGFRLASMTRHELAALDSQAALALLRKRFPALAPWASQRVLDEAQGNPLALLELPPVLTGSQQAAGQALPSVLPLPDRLQTLFTARLSALPEATCQVLLLAALAGTGDLALLDTVVGSRLLGDLAPAERVGLVRVDDTSRQLVFRHPLTRSAVVGMSTAAERRAAHWRLADALAAQPDRACRHLAAAALGPDEDVAAALEDSARRILRRGDTVDAAILLAQAADLTLDQGRRSDRLAEAAFIDGTMGWQMDRVPVLLAKARQAPLGAGAELHAVAADAYVMLNGDGDVDTAHQHVVAAIEALGGAFDAGDRPLVGADRRASSCAYGAAERSCGGRTWWRWGG